MIFALLLSLTWGQTNEPPVGGQIGKIDFRPGLADVGHFSSHVPKGVDSFKLGRIIYEKGGDEPFNANLHTLIRTGQTFDGVRFGDVVDDSGNPSWLHWAMDYSGLLYKHDRVWMLSHFEARVGMVYVTEVHQEPETGILTPVKTTPLDPKTVHPDFKFFSAPVSGSTTTWNTFLSVSEYPLDPKWLDNPDFTQKDICEHDYIGSAWPEYPHLNGESTVFKFFGKTCDQTKPLQELKNEFLALYGSVYWNGVAFEVDIAGVDDYRVTVHWSMGRYSGERPVVMPDDKTVYITSDTYTDSLYRFVADTAFDLSCGTLYAVKLVQRSGVGRLEKIYFDVEWVDLGHACDGDIDMDQLASLSAADFFDIVPANGDGTCPTGYKISEMHKLYSQNVECVQLKAGANVKLASRLETQRYAAWLGCTQELSKVEGIVFDKDKKDRLYFALSYVEKAMLDGNTTDPNDWNFGGRNDIKTQPNSYGCVFQMWLDENFAGTSVDALKCGSEDTFHNPDNLDFIKGRGHVTIIAEDSYRGQESRMTNYAWEFRADHLEEPPAAILQGVNGAQIAMGYSYVLGPDTPDLKHTWEYIVFVVQHPYKGYKLPEGCDPLGENAACGAFTGTGDWIVYYKYPYMSCHDGLPEKLNTDSDSWEDYREYHRKYCVAESQSASAEAGEEAAAQVGEGDSEGTQGGTYTYNYTTKKEASLVWAVVLFAILFGLTLISFGAYCFLMQKLQSQFDFDPVSPVDPQKV